MKKFQYIDFASLILSLMVVFIHVSSEIIAVYPKEGWLYPYVFIIWKLCSYAVPAFIFLSGFKLFLNEKIMDMSYGLYLKKRLKSIVVPYVIWFCIYYLYFIRYGYYTFNGVEMIKMFFLGNLVSHFYFITIIVQFYLLFPLWKTMLKAKPWIGITIALGLTLFLKHLMGTNGFIYIDRVFSTYLIYWILGCYMGRYKDVIIKKMIPYNGIILGVFVVMAFVHIYRSVDQSLYNVLYPHAEEWHILFCVLGALATLSFSHGLAEKSKVARALAEKFGPLTFQVYLLHVLVIYIVNDQLIKYDFTLGMRFGIRFIMTYSISFFMAWLLHNTLQKYKGLMKRA